MILNAAWKTVHFISDLTLLKFWKSLDYKYRRRTRKNASYRGKIPKKFENPLSQGRSDQIVLKYFGRKFATSFRSGAAKYSWGFVSLLELRGPNFVETKPEEKKVRKRSYWTKPKLKTSWTKNWRKKGTRRTRIRCTTRSLFSPMPICFRCLRVLRSSFSSSSDDITLW